MTSPDWQDASTQAITSKEAKIAVVGCGYVGLTLALGFARKGFTVLGVEPSDVRVKAFQDGLNPVPDVEVPDGELNSLRESGHLTFTPALSETADAYLICVPTPLRDGSPDLHHVEQAGEAVGAYLKRGDVVVLESTTYPGTTEELLRPILEAGSSLKAGEDFALANSPERIDPGNKTWNLFNTPKVAGGLTPSCTAVTAALYEQVCDRVVTVASPRAAEITKLLENTYREVNIALANEMAIVCHDFMIDPWEVVEAAASKPFGFTPFKPGPGVGGHCIGIDPQYLAWRVRGKAGRQFRLLETSHDVNQRMPGFVAQRVAEILNDEGKALRGATVLILGMAYKGGSGDIRESPSIRVAARLIRSGAKIAYHDPYVPSVVIDDVRHESVEMSGGFVAWADIVVILTDHPGLDYESVVHQARAVYDMRGVTRDIPLPENTRLYRI